MPQPVAAPGAGWTFAGWLAAIALGLFCAGVVRAADEGPGAAQAAQQAAWVASHSGAIRVAPENNYPPFSFVEDGAWRGLSADMIRLMQAHMPRPFDILPAQDLNHILAQVQQGDVEVVTSLKETPERTRFLAFTPPYIRVPTAILVKSTSQPASWPQGYVGKNVAVGKGYGVQSYLEQKYPAIHLSLVADDLEGMRQLSFGAVDAVIMDMASASYFIEREKFTNLRVASGFEYTYDLSFAVRKDEPVLRDLMAHALAAIAQPEKEALFRKWMPLVEDPFAPLRDLLDRALPWLVAGLLAGVSVGALAWSARRRRRRTERAASVYARSLIESSLDPLVTISAQGKITDVNSATEQVTGRRRTELIGSDFADYFTAPERARSGYRQAFEKGFVTDYPLAIRHASGSVTEVLYNANVYRGEDGQVLGVFAAARDVTARNRAESQMQAASVFSHAREGILICGADTRVLNANQAFTRITGFEAAEVLGQVPALLQSDQQEPAFYAAMWAELAAQGQWHGELWDRRKNGELFAATLTISAVHDEQGRTGHYVLLFSDVTALRQHQQQLEQLAHFDTLTRLPNRLLLSDRLRQGLIHAERRGLKLAVAYLDLDGFKAINDEHGHAVGDRLLVQLSDRLTKSLREGDTFARLGGDEFVAVLTDLENVDAAVPVLERMLQAAAQVVQIDNLALQVSASIGVAYFPQVAGTDAEQLLRQADQAMYHAKLSGKNRYAVFDAENDLSVRGHHAGLERIRQALAADEFVLYYQPKVNLRTRDFIGVEALIRWMHPQEGLLAPGQFLPLIENHRLSVHVGEWVIRQALQQLSRWQQAGTLVPVSVNISAMQLQQPDFFDRLQTLMAGFPGLPPHSLQLEILETSALEDIDQVARFIGRCADLGVGFALDDFGTGYSSLTYLKRLPISTVKIDQSFVRDMLLDRDNRSILDGILWIMRQLHRSVIAEGVETLEHARTLMDLGCEMAQGYGIARPMPVDQLPAWLQRWQTDTAWQAVALVPRTAV